MADLDTEFSDEAVRLRSFSIWQREGCPQDRALDHWLRAKAELEAELRADPPPRKPLSIVMPRVPISQRPNRRIAAKIGRDAA